MQLGTVVAGFDAAGRAKLRRAIGKKKVDLMAEVGKAFLDGAGREFRDDDGDVISPVFARATAERLWDMLKGSASYAFNKCLTADTVLGASSQVEWTIGELYRRIEACTSGPSTDGLCRFDGRRAIRTTGRCKVCDNWWHKFSHPDRGLTILAYDFADDRIRPKRVKTVNYNGVRPVFRIELSDGRSVKATDNHRFLTPSGWRQLFDMSVGDTLLTHGGYEKSGTSLDDLRTTSGERQGVGTVWGRMDDNVGFVDGGFVALQSWTEQSTDCRAQALQRLLPDRGSSRTCAPRRQPAQQHARQPFLDVRVTPQAARLRPQWPPPTLAEGPRRHRGQDHFDHRRRLRGRLRRRDGRCQPLIRRERHRQPQQPLAGLREGHVPDRLCEGELAGADRGRGVGLHRRRREAAPGAAGSGCRWHRGRTAGRQ